MMITSIKQKLSYYKFVDEEKAIDRIMKFIEAASNELAPVSTANSEIGLATSQNSTGINKMR
jgi:hypothetical protein